jgi:hypothetical protein
MVFEQLDTFLKKNQKTKYFLFIISLIYFFSTPNIFFPDNWWSRAFFSLEENPFQFNEMSNRILFPLLSYTLRKIIFFDSISSQVSHLIINHLIIFTIVIINLNYFLKNFNKIYLILIIFFINSYILLPIRFPLYNDLLTILMLNLSLLNLKNNKSYFYLILAFLSHEIAIFSAPFIFLIKKKEGIDPQKIIFILCIFFMIIFYLTHKYFYTGYNEQYDELSKISYNLSSIFNHILKTIELSFSGIFSSFKIIWVILVFNLVKEKKIFQPLNIYFFIIFILTYLYSTDHTRHAYLLLFVYMFYNLIIFFKNNENKNLLFTLALCQLILPNQAYFAEPYIIHHFPLEFIFNFDLLRGYF